MKTNTSVRVTTALLLAFLTGAAGGCKHYTISDTPAITPPPESVQPPGAIEQPAAITPVPPGTVSIPGGKGWSNPK